MRDEHRERLMVREEQFDRERRLSKIVFVFDRVMHYHRALFVRLDRELGQLGHELILLSGKEKATTTGRVALKTQVVRNQIEFELDEWPIRTFMVRYQHGVARRIQEIRPDIVVTTCHSGTVSEWQIAGLKRKLDFKLVAWQCGYEFNPGNLKRFVLSKFVPRFDYHLAYHSNAKHYAINHGARPEQVTVMHNTINEAAIECLPKQQARQLINAQWPILQNKKLVLYVGAILEEKRLEVVFEALDLMHRADVMFLMVGDGPHRQRINEKFGHRKDFLSTGQIVQGVGPYFDAADLFVLPGTGGLAINEAMAHGLPVVSGYADGSADDLVVDGKSGYRLRQGTAAELAARLHDVLANEAVASSMGETGRAMIHGDLSFERFIARVVGVLTSPQLQRGRS
jgi:glycosyltransferase involved in cell wall biosynthesis